MWPGVFVCLKDREEEITVIQGKKNYMRTERQDYKCIKNKKEKNKRKIYHGKGEAKQIGKKRICLQESYLQC